MKIEKVAKSDILFSQEYLDSDTVEKHKNSYTNNPLKDELPVLVNVCGKFLVKDGHHRIFSVKEDNVYCLCITTNNIREFMAPHVNITPKIEAKNFINSFLMSSLNDRRSMMSYLHLVK